MLGMKKLELAALRPRSGAPTSDPLAAKAAS